MDERVKELLEQQAAWQRERASLPWEEKIRLSLIMRAAQESLRKNPRAQPTAGERK